MPLSNEIKNIIVVGRSNYNALTMSKNDYSLYF